MTTQLLHENEATRYSLRIGGDLVAVADYRLDDSSITFTRTYTEPEHRGHGYAADLVKFAIDDVESTTSLRIVPQCWYVAEWFESNPDRAALLAR